MTNFRKTIALSLMAASFGAGVIETSTSATAWEFQHRNLSSGFNHYQYWGPGVGGVSPAATYNAFPNTYQPNCYITTQTAIGNNGFAYYAVERVCN